MVFLPETGIQSSHSEGGNIPVRRLGNEIVKPGTYRALVTGQNVSFVDQMSASRVAIDDKCFLPLRDCFLVHSLAVVCVSESPSRQAKVGIQLEGFLILFDRPVELMP